MKQLNEMSNETNISRNVVFINIENDFHKFTRKSIKESVMQRNINETMIKSILSLFKVLKTEPKI